jgi:Cupredoxin-like domain
MASLHGSLRAAKRPLREPEALKVKANTPFVLLITNKARSRTSSRSRKLRTEKFLHPEETVRLKMPALKPGTDDVIDDSKPPMKGKLVAEFDAIAGAWWRGAWSSASCSPSSATPQRGLIGRVQRPA